MWVHLFRLTTVDLSLNFDEREKMDTKQPLLDTKWVHIFSCLSRIIAYFHCYVRMLHKNNFVFQIEQVHKRFCNIPIKKILKVGAKTIL